MTISSTTNKVQYTGDGVQDEFPFTFRILVDSDLEVYVDDDLKVLNTDYTVEGGTSEGTGKVVFTAAPADQTNITIVRNVPSTQEVDYVDYDRFAAETHEGALDKLTMLIQEVEEQLGRSLQYSVTSPSQEPFTVNFGSAAERAGKIWAFDATGNIVILIDTAEEKAYKWAEEDEDVVVENRGGQDRFSARHWAIKAANTVTPPMTNKGELYGHSGVGPTQVLVERANGDPAQNGDFIIKNDSVDSGISYAAPVQQLPPLQAGDKLKMLQVNLAENGYELTDQYSTTLQTGDELIESDESGGEVSGFYAPHYKLVGMRMVNPVGDANPAQCFARFILRRHDQLPYDFGIRLSRAIGDVSAGTDVVFRITPYIHQSTGDSVNPPAGTPAQQIVTLPASDTSSIFVNFSGLVPANASADPDVLCVFQIDRIVTGGDYVGQVDIVTAFIGPTP